MPFLIPFLRSNQLTEFWHIRRTTSTALSHRHCELAFERRQTFACLRLDSSKMELVQKKCASRTAGHFVFDRQPKIVRGASRLTGFSSIQTDILRLNAENGNKISLEIQLKGLSASIQMFLKRSNHIGQDVISAYHDRSLVLYHLERFDKCICDASFIIEKCPYYSNAYMIRSRALLQENRLYEAYDDIMQACILEKFAENEINAMLTIIVKKIGEH